MFDNFDNFAKNTAVIFDDGSELTYAELQARINEISSSYPTDGWMLGYYTNLISEEIAKSSNTKRESIKNQENIVSEFSDRFDNDDPIFFIKIKNRLKKSRTSDQFLVRI